MPGILLAAYFDSADYQNMAAEMLSQIANTKHRPPYHDSVYNLNNALKSVDIAFKELGPIIFQKNRQDED